MARKNLSQTTVSFNVKLTLPPGANKKDGQDYVREAVKSHWGNVPASSSMQHLDGESVTVALISSTTNYQYAK